MEGASKHRSGNAGCARHRGQPFCDLIKFPAGYVYNIGMITFRPGTPADTRATFDIFLKTFLDLSLRLGTPAITNGDDPNVIAGLWDARRSLFEHLTLTAERFVIAENHGRPVGYGRAILRDGVRELTEFFVLPGEQSAGIGRDLLARVFPADGAIRRTVIATTDSRAQARYLKARVYAHFPIYYFSRQPAAVTAETDLVIEPVGESPETLAATGQIDLQIIGHRRDIDHAWLMTERQAYFYRRDGRVVGYGYVGRNCGPFALLDDNDFPAVLAHAETRLAGAEKFGVEVPLINKAAVDYLLARGCKMDGFFALYMTDHPPGKFTNYLFTSPPLFV